MNSRRLQNFPIWKIWVGLVLATFVASEVVVSAVELSLFGVVTWDYLLTCAITSVLVGSAVSGYILTFLAEARRLSIELAGSEDQMRRRVDEKTAELNGTLEALRRSESGIRDILDNSANVVFLKDLEGRYLLVNRRYEELFHVGRNVVLGKTDHDIFPAEFARSFQEADRRALEAGSPIEVEELVPHDEGLHSYISIKFPISGDDGKPYAVCGIATDITVRKRAEEALRISEERLRLAMEATQQGWFDLNVQTGEVVASQEFARIVGEDPARSRMNFQTWIGSIHREDRDGILDAYKQCLRTGQARPMEYRMLAKTGEWKWIRSTGKIVGFDSRGVPVRMTGTHADVTERRRTEEAMQVADKRYRSLFQAASDCILVIDRDGNLLDINDRGAMTLGYTRDELLGESFSRVLDAQLMARMYPRPADMLVERRTVRGEQEIRSKRGAVRFVEFVASPMADGNVLAVVRDVTDRKRLEEVRMRSQNLESLGTLAGGIAHDFNNILLAINGNAKLALEDLHEDHPARESVAEITRAGQRASDLVRRILAFSRPQVEKRKVTELRPVMEEAIKLLRATLPATIEFRTRYCEEPMLAEADASQVHEAVVNLATNAAYAIGDRAGWIEFSLVPLLVSQELADKVTGLLSGRYARLSVSDSGCGMDQATQRRIFDAFYTTKPIGQGTGLGLSMVHGILKGHGGAIEVESALDKGSRFHLYFPLVEAPAGEDAGIRAAEPTPVEGKHVLYVDDEEVLVFLMRRVLERKGHKVSGFTDARAALEEFRGRPLEFDVVVTDFSMPGMSGIDFAMAVRALRSDIPVLMATGFARSEDEKRARAAGILRVIPKPNTADDMGEIFDQLFRDGGDPVRVSPG